MPAPPFSRCRYSAFLSYAHADDDAWANWVTDFCSELDYSLPGRTTGIEVPPAHLSSKNGPIRGPLNDALRANIEGSFAVIIFVHDNYLASEWCLQELQHFRSLFGDEGFASRLYIVALSETAIKTLTQRASWREMFPRGDQVWMPFFDSEFPDRPMSIYAIDTRRGRKVVISTEFWERFVRLREELAQAIRADCERAAAERLRGYPVNAAAAAPAAGERRMVRLYIEGNADQERYWEGLGTQLVSSWDQVMAEESNEPALRLRPTGLDMRNLEDRPLLDDADGVVLMWGQKTPDTVFAEISRVEPKLSGPNFAPGLVAYLMRNGHDQPPQTQINNWPVVRFLAREDGSATVLASDAPLLTTFVHEVLAHKRSAG